jgi:hypothetical protein
MAFAHIFKKTKITNTNQKEKDSIFGALTDTQEINHTIQELKKKKKIHCSINHETVQI